MVQFLGPETVLYGRLELYDSVSSISSLVTQFSSSSKVITSFSSVDTETSVPVYWAEKVRSDLERDVRVGVLA